MKKIYKPVLIFCTAFLFLGMNSCDILEQLFVNLAMKETITASGNGPDISEIVKSLRQILKLLKFLS